MWRPSSPSGKHCWWQWSPRQYSSFPNQDCPMLWFVTSRLQLISFSLSVLGTEHRRRSEQITTDSTFLRHQNKEEKFINLLRTLLRSACVNNYSSLKSWSWESCPPMCFLKATRTCSKSIGLLQFDKKTSLKIFLKIWFERYRNFRSCSALLLRLTLAFSACFVLSLSIACLFLLIFILYRILIWSYSLSAPTVNKLIYEL